MDRDNTEFVLKPEFTEKMKKLLGDEWEDFLYSYNHDRYQALRINVLKKGTDKKMEEDILHTAGVQETKAVPWSENCYYYSEEERPGKHVYHHMGVYYIQEPSAMSAAALLKPKSFERVLDLCAAPGGKTTQLAAYMESKGLLVSNEIHPARCRILSQNVERMGLANVIVTNEDSFAMAERFNEYFDKILVDAPCSGEGMFRKNHEAMDEWSPEQVKKCAERQREILDNAAIMLKCGGTLCYSTCTFSPEENEETVAYFLEKHRDFSVLKAEAPYFQPGRADWCGGVKEVEDTYRLFPHKLNGEGHYVAVLRKAGLDEESPEEARGKGKKKNSRENNIPDKKQREALEMFIRETLNKEAGDFILSGKLILFGEQLYRMDREWDIDITGLKVLRPGLHIGMFKKDRFEPSHALALFLGEDDVKNAAALDSSDTRTEMYIKGEAIEYDSDKKLKGWCLVTADSMSLGWGKITDGQIKNHYPKGLRAV